MIWIDILIILTFIIFIIIGCKKGFVFSILSLFSSTVNFFISIFLCKPTSNLLNKIFNIEGTLTNTYLTKFTNISNNFNIKLSNFTNQTELNNHISQTINNSSLSGFSKKILNNTINIKPENIKNPDITLNDIISKSIAQFLTIIISFVLVFLFIYFILWIISLISKKANTIDDIRLTDRILGVIFGFTKAFLIIIFIFSIISLFNEQGILSFLFNNIKQSTIGNWLYTNVNYFTDKYFNLKTILPHLF